MPDIVAVERLLPRLATVPIRPEPHDCQGRNRELGSASTLLSSRGTAWAAGTRLLASYSTVVSFARLLQLRRPKQASAAYDQAATVAFRDIEAGLGRGLVLEQRVNLNLALGGGATVAVDVIDWRLRDALRGSKPLQLLLAAGFAGKPGD